MTLDSIIDLASQKYPAIRDAHNGKTTDPFALFLHTAIVRAYSPKSKEFEQLTKCAQGVQQHAECIYEVWSHLLKYASEQASGKPRHYDKVGA